MHGAMAYDAWKLRLKIESAAERKEWVQHGATKKGTHQALFPMLISLDIFGLWYFFKKNPIILQGGSSFWFCLLRTGLCASVLQAAGGQQGTRRRRGRHIYGRTGCFCFPYYIWSESLWLDWDLVSQIFAGPWCLTMMTRCGEEFFWSEIKRRLVLGEEFIESIPSSEKCGAIFSMSVPI